MENYLSPALQPADVDAVSSLGLAHVGDGVYELLVRTWLACHGRLTSSELHRATVHYVSAPAQAAAAMRLLPQLTEEEQTWFRRGRNAHPHHGVPKGATAGEYARATGLETLFGALYLLGRTERVNALFTYLMEEEDAF